MPSRRAGRHAGPTGPQWASALEDDIHADFTSILPSMLFQSTQFTCCRHQQAGARWSQKHKGNKNLDCLGLTPSAGKKLVNQLVIKQA
jgi:hypothetical protein